jgi:hypothetical protein
MRIISSGDGRLGDGRTRFSEPRRPLVLSALTSGLLAIRNAQALASSNAAEELKPAPIGTSLVMTASKPRNRKPSFFKR